MRIRRVKGNIIKRTGGDYNMYAGEDIITTSNGPITEHGEEGGVIYGEPEPYNNKESCNYEPKKVKTGGCDYYILRVEDFFKRHPECKHFPPVYYYGEIRIPGRLSKGDQEESKRYDPYGHNTPYPISYEDRIKKKKNKEEGIQTRRNNRDKSPPFFKKNIDLETIKYVGTLEESYGTKYCNAFTKLRPELSKAGQEWLDETLLDLQKLMEKGVVDKYYIAKYNEDYNIRNSLVDDKGAPVAKPIIERFYDRIELNESRFKDFAFATHPDAYNPKKMQELPIIWDLYKIGTTPEFKEWLEPETREQAIIMGKEMGKNKWEELSGKAKEKLKKYWDKISN